MKKFLLPILFFFFIASVLVLSLRGIPGNPTPAELNTQKWKEAGPLELSPERGRYALTYSVVENQSLFFTPDLARFVAPDVAYQNGRYVSLFAPSLSFLAIPGYVIGKFFGMAQVGSFAMIALFALFNVYLIRAIAIRLGAHPLAGSIASIAFLFASPAFSYAVTLYQHHVSTFLILLAAYLLIRFNSVWSLALIWLLATFSITLDYPNFFMMIPIGVLGLIRTFPVKQALGKVSVSIPFMRILAMFAVILPLLFFFWFNQVSYGSPFRLSGANERAIEVKADGSPLLETEIAKRRQKEEKKPVVQASDESLLGFFRNRNMINGFYTHFTSQDRGMLMYTPVMLFGMLGFVFALYRRVQYTALLAAILGFNIVLYSMWGDPYGGWAFGSRYLIPTYAILSIFMALALTQFGKYNLFLLFFFVVFNYSVGVNTLGALTTGRIPPKVEAAALEKISGIHQDYTYRRNFGLLQGDASKSFVYQSFVKKYLSAWNYYIVITTLIAGVTAVLILLFKATPKVVKKTHRSVHDVAFRQKYWRRNI